MIKKFIVILTFIMIFTICFGCMSSPEIEPEFQLLGEAEIEVNNGESFEDPGFIAQLNGNDISDLVIVETNLDIYTTGDYSISYSLTLDSKEYRIQRIVHVNNILVRYFHQIDPGLTPTIFASEMISTDSTSEFACTFSPDYKYFFFTRRNAYNDNRIFYSKFESGQWTIPELSPVSMDITEFEPFITPDGHYLYFGSKRNGTYQMKIYRSEYTDNEWRDPEYVENELNDDFAMYISVADNQNLYFTSSTGISVMKYQNGEYLLPEPTGIVGAHSFIAHDESYMLFDDSGSGEEFTSLFISYNMNGSWSTPVKLPQSINQNGSNQICPMISPDGKFLFFSRFTNGRADIYWVSIDILINL